MDARSETRTIRILVKAFPQPSQKYEETVCCAGVTEDTGELLRLFPIRYRRLPPSDRFGRYDRVEMLITKASDPRPESYQVAEESIRLLEKGTALPDQAKVRLWAPFIAPSLKELHRENRENQRSLGIVKPDPGSIRFRAVSAEASSEEDQKVAELLFQQQSFLEEPLKPLERPQYSFVYEYTCAGHPHRHQIHDWEVQAAFFNYRRRYSSEQEALNQLTFVYETDIPARNLHFIMGTMKAHPRTFILIGLLRSPLDPAEITRQQSLL